MPSHPTTADISNYNKNGRFGNAKDGSITPGQIFAPTRNGGTRDLSVSGDPGDFVSDVALDTTNNILRISKGRFAGLEGKIKYGGVYKNKIVFNASEPVDVDDWTKYDLPSTFKHGDDLSNDLPDGIGFVRLAAGSLAVGSSAWNADATSYGSSRTIPAVQPVAIFAQVDSNSNSIINVWFNVAIGSLISDYTNLVKINTTSASALFPIGQKIGTKANCVVYNLNRVVNMDSETVTIRIASGVILAGVKNNSPNAGSISLPVSNCRAKDCYLLAMNRAELSDISAGNFVLLSGYELIFDAVGNYRYVYDTLAMGGAAEAVPVAYGLIYGGNSNPISGSSASDYKYPTYKPYVFQLGANDALTKPDDWTKVELPSTFAHGDATPTIPLPNGIGFVRLSPRSASLGSSAWDADAIAFGSSNNDPLNPPSLAKAVIKNGNQLWLYWSEPVIFPPMFQNPNTGVVDPINYVITLNAATALNAISYLGSDNTNITKFSLDRSPVSTEVITIAYGGGSVLVQRGLVKDIDGNWNSIAIADNLVTFSLAKNDYVLVVNRNSQKGFREGDLVDIYDNGEVLLDNQSPANSRKLYDILPRLSQSQMPHRHLHDGANLTGGGYAFASFLPTTYQQLVTLGMSDIIRASSQQ